LKLKGKLIAAVAAGLMLVGLTAAPASADYSNNVVVNRSNGWVQVQTDSGNYYWLAGYGTKMYNVDYVVVTPGSCVGVSVYRYCANQFQTYKVSVANNAQVTVNRLS
jgi:hypothetical protein